MSGLRRLLPLLVSCPVGAFIAPTTRCLPSSFSRRVACFRSFQMDGTSGTRPLDASVAIEPSSGKHDSSVIFLHGSGDSGDGIKQWVGGEQGPFAFEKTRVVFPSAHMRKYSMLGPHGVQRVWFDRVALGPQGAEDSVGMDAMSKLVKQLVYEEVGKGVPLSRIIVGGFSMGGAQSLHTVLADCIVNQVSHCRVLKLMQSTDERFGGTRRRLPGCLRCRLSLPTTGQLRGGLSAGCAMRGPDVAHRGTSVLPKRLEQYSKQGTILLVVLRIRDAMFSANGTSATPRRLHPTHPLLPRRGRLDDRLQAHDPVHAHVPAVRCPKLTSGFVGPAGGQRAWRSSARLAQVCLHHADRASICGRCDADICGESWAQRSIGAPTPAWTMICAGKSSSGSESGSSRASPLLRAHKTSPLQAPFTEILLEPHVNSLHSREEHSALADNGRIPTARFHPGPRPSHPSSSPGLSWKLYSRFVLDCTFTPSAVQQIEALNTALQTRAQQTSKPRTKQLETSTQFEMTIGGSG